MLKEKKLSAYFFYDLNNPLYDLLTGKKVIIVIWMQAMVNNLIFVIIPQAIPNNFYELRNTSSPFLPTYSRGGIPVFLPGK